MNTETVPVTKPATSLDKSFWYHGSLVTVLIDGSQTGGRYAQLAMTVQPGCEPPAHTHTREDETFYLLEGSIRFTIGKHVFTANPGDYVCMPKNIQHTFEVLTPVAKTVMTIAPAGFENYFQTPGLAEPATSLTIPPVPQGPPPAEAIEAMLKLLDEQYAIRM
ncbi:cupin domain-containing protein [Fibrella sp. HMF5335]|uniref:Cupin domain-containing protein n=1 Tax=Fibrella rubiginis TaxID=2817060 RepID=A0A939K471_9BACT|nr:cupin domain-containing protein [Fibrella rubiginis]MBO0935861.1 cupin domain-containing protein [Fibrella rubiginis]